MKNTTASVIGIMFTAAFITFTGMGIVPPEAFAAVATGSIVYWFKDKELNDTIRRLSK